MESEVAKLPQRKPPINHVRTCAYVGLGTGTIGAAFAAGYATLKGRPVVLWTTFSGAQCFIIGSSFWFTRGLAAAYALSDQRDALSFREELMYSSLSGSVAGMVGGAVRGRANIIPGAIVLGLVGLSGQAGLSLFAGRDPGSRDNRPLLDRLSDSRWWPLKSIPNAEYKQQLLDKISAMDVEISTIDEQILTLKQKRQAISRKD